MAYFDARTLRKIILEHLGYVPGDHEDLFQTASVEALAEIIADIDYVMETEDLMDEYPIGEIPFTVSNVGYFLRAAQGPSSEDIPLETMLPIRFSPCETPEQPAS